MAFLWSFFIIIIFYLLLSSGRNEMTADLAKKLILNYGALVDKYHKAFPVVPTSKIYAIIGTESGGDPLAVGDNGRSRGLMQVGKAALQDVNTNFGKSYSFDDLFTDWVNIEVGTAFYFLKMRDTGYDLNSATRAYNGGMGNKETADAYAYMDRVNTAEKIVLSVMETL